MASLEQIQQVIEELGPATEEVAEIQQQDNTAWVVFCDEDVAVGMDFEEEQQKLVLSIDLGAPPKEKKAESYEFLLLYNYSWQESGGIKMGLEAPDGSIVMMFELNTAALELSALQHVLANFVQLTRRWRALVALGLGGGGSSNEEGEVQVELPGAIRV